jgi:hypothetical protein
MLRNGDYIGLTGDAAVLPESIQPRQSETSQKAEGQSNDVVQGCYYTCGKMPFPKFSRTTICFQKRRKVASDKLRKRVYFQKAPS